MIVSHGKTTTGCLGRDIRVVGMFRMRWLVVCSCGWRDREKYQWDAHLSWMKHVGLGDQDAR